jgi:hypothetical protein
MVKLASYSDLVDYVRRVLCGRADVCLETPLLACTLRRGQFRCGVEFTLLAPRSVRLSAIWEARTNRVLFYDQDLERFLVARIAGVSVEHIPVSEAHPAVASMWRGK